MKVRRKKIPMRMCIGCKEMKPKKELTRIVRTPEGEIIIDTSGKKSGRGAYICKDVQCIKEFLNEKTLSKALDFNVTKELVQRLQEELSNS